MNKSIAYMINDMKQNLISVLLYEPSHDLNHTFYFSDVKCLLLFWIIFIY